MSRAVICQNSPFPLQPDGLILGFRLPDPNHHPTLRAADHVAGLFPAGVISKFVAALGAFDAGGVFVGRFFRMFIGYHVLSN